MSKAFFTKAKMGIHGRVKMKKLDKQTFEAMLRDIPTFAIRRIRIGSKNEQKRIEKKNWAFYPNALFIFKGI